jgi:hypothetical protein
MLVEKTYYDSDPNKAWICRFDVLQIKRDHRRILNDRPKVTICYKCNSRCANIRYDVDIMCN